MKKSVIKTKDFLKFLSLLDIGLVRNNGTSHWIFDRKTPPRLNRPLVIKAKEKEMPMFYVTKMLRQIDVDFEQFENWLDNN